MSLIATVSSQCAFCGCTFKTDSPELYISHGGGFTADLQPGYSAPLHTIWETHLFSCPECGYTTFGPASDWHSKQAREMAGFVETVLKPFVKRQQPSANAWPSLTSKYELYGMQLDDRRAEDHLIGDCFLRASWSARVCGRPLEERRLRSLAAARYEKALVTTAKALIEEEIVALYLLAELYRLTGEVGRQLRAVERLKGLRGRSQIGERLIRVAVQQHERPREDEVVWSEPGAMEYLWFYRSAALTNGAYGALLSGNQELASELLRRAFDICEGPLRAGLILRSPHTLSTYDPLDKYGVLACIGLRELATHGFSVGVAVSELDVLISRAAAPYASICTDAYFKLGSAWAEHSAWDAAVACYEHALTIDPHYVPGWAGKGLALANQNRYSEAVSCYDKVLALRANDSEILYSKGVAMMELGHKDDAKRLYAEALTVDPNHVGALYSYGWHLFDSGLREEAAGCFTRCLELEPNHPKAALVRHRLDQCRAHPWWQRLGMTPWRPRLRK